jgi:hypothetical protein
MYQSSRRAKCSFCGQLVYKEQLSRYEYQSDFEVMWVEGSDIICTQCSQRLPPQFVDKGKAFHLVFRAY